MVEYEIKGGKVINEKASEPDLRAFALERFMKAMASFWLEQ